MPPWRQNRATQELEQKSRQSLRSVSVLALGQLCTLRIMPSGLHTQGMLRQHTLLNNLWNQLEPFAIRGHASQLLSAALHSCTDTQRQLWGCLA